MQPTLNLNLAETKKLDKRITFTRNSVGTYFDRNGVMKTAIADVPRFDHDPVTKSSLGLLIEESRLNVFQNSYAVNGGGLSDGTAMSPDGTIAKKFVLTGGLTNYPGTDAYNVVSGSLVNGTTYDVSFSGYFKNFGASDYRPYLVVAADNTGTNAVYATLLVDAAIGTSTPGYGTGFTQLTTPVVALMPCGMYKVTWSVRFTQDATARNRVIVQVQVRNSATSGTFTADGSSGIQLACVQAELGAFPTSYIPTTTSAVTRNADVAQATGTEFTSWYNPNEGTVISSGFGNGTSGSFSYITNSTGSYRIQLAPTAIAIVNNSSVDAVFYGAAALTPTTLTIAYKVNDIASFRHGGVLATDTLCQIPTGIDRLRIGSDNFGNYLNGCISQVKYYPKRLDNATLKNLSYNQSEYFPKESREFNFTKGSIDLAGLVFTRNDTNATYFDKTGVMRVAAANRPRVDYDPSTLECRGLLLEPTRTNHLGYTGTLGTGWTISSATLTPNQPGAPDGTSTAIILNDTSDTGYGSAIHNAIAYTPGTYMCASIYVKKDAIPRSTRFPMLRIAFQTGTSRYIDYAFDTSTGEPYIYQQSALVTLGVSGVQDCGKWWRVYVSASSSDAGNNASQIQFYSAVGQGEWIYSNTIVDSCTIWGPQFETGAVPTSYIPCPTTSQTRNDETLKSDGTGFSSWFNKLSSAEYTILCSGRYMGPSTGTNYASIYSISDDSAGERIELAYSLASPRFYTYIADNSTVQYSTDTANNQITRNVSFNHGLTVGNGTFMSVLNENAPIPGTGTLPTSIVFRIGSGYNTLSKWHGYVERLMFYGEQVTKTQLQQMVRRSSKAISAPTLALHFDKMVSLPKTITFTRADATTCASYFDKAGVMRFAAANEPRLDYDPATLEPLGLLMEESRTNLFAGSQDLSHANWNKSNIDVDGTPAYIDVAVAPDGSSTADKMIETTSATTHYVYMARTNTANTNYVFSVFIKAAGQTSCVVQYGKAGSPYTRMGIQVNLTDGSFVDYNSGSPTSVSIKMVQNVGNGWYRISIGGIFDTTSTDALGMIYIHNGTTYTYAGDGTSGIYMWGAQLEEGEHPTSYIPTTTAGITRAADAATMTGTNFSSWYNPNEGSIIVRGNSIYSSSVATYPRLVSINDGNGQTDCIQCVYITAGNTAYWSVYDATVSQAYTQGVTTVSGNYNTIACSYNQTTLHGAANSVIGSVDSTIGTFPVVNRLDIGHGSGSSILNGHVSKFVYFPKKFTEIELRDLSKNK